jgi:hypothetical protein
MNNTTVQQHYLEFTCKHPHLDPHSTLIFTDASIINKKIGIGIHIPKTNTNISKSIELNIPISAAEMMAIKISKETHNHPHRLQINKRT